MLEYDFKIPKKIERKRYERIEIRALLMHDYT